jgi:hypothetical protein
VSRRRRRRTNSKIRRKTERKGNKEKYGKK